jgi:hypothetical protein
MQTKRTIFSNRVLPYLLLAPQLAITLIFFIWPAFQAFRQSFLREDPFGMKSTFVWFTNYTKLFASADYLNALWVTLIFAVSVTVLSMGLSLLFAVCVNRVLRSGRLYTTLLVWPYAVAPAAAGLLWWFMFNPSIGILPYVLRYFGYDWNYRLPVQAVLDGGFPTAFTDNLLPGGRQHHLCAFRHLPDYRLHHFRRPIAIDQHTGLQGLCRRFRRAQSWPFRSPVCRADADCRRAHCHPVPLDRKQSAVLRLIRWSKIVPF